MGVRAAAVEPTADTPAFRGLAYAVFDDLDLEPYGNRIPTISITADARVKLTRWAVTMP